MNEERMTILDRIVAQTKEKVFERKTRVPAGCLARACSGPQPFFKRNGVTVIAESKKGSPSKGIFVEQYEPASIARDYQKGGASAISILTEEDFFHGSLQHLDAVRSAVDLPVLRKDFVVGEYQIIESWARGADAVLLIAAALDDFQLHDLNDAAQSLGLSVICEAHDESEIERALRLNDAAIGVNARDLRDFTVSLSRTAVLRPLIPQGRIAVGESGIMNTADARTLVDAGYNALLIGEYFITSWDRTGAVKGIVDALKK